MAEDVNTTNTDIANALTGSVATDGSAAMTGPLTLSADPTQPLQAATKQYTDAQRTFVTTNYVAKAGDTMTGALNMSSQNISGVNTLTGSNFTVNTNLTVNGSAYVAGLRLTSPMNANNNNILTVNNYTGVSGSVAQNWGVGGQLTVTGGIIAIGNSSQFYLQDEPGSRILNYSANWYWGFTNSTGDLQWNNASASSRNVYFLASGACYNSDGVWHVNSDVRLKQDIADYTAGLDIVQQLRPRTFRRIADVQLAGQERGGITVGEAKTEVGLIAQECEALLPFAVHQHRAELPDGTEADDVRALCSQPVIWVLVNAVKELAARIETLEASIR
jgi:hypothetical protein